MILKNYKYNIKNNIFRLRSKNYNFNKKKIMKPPLLNLENIYIINDNFSNKNFPEIGNNNLIVKFKFCNKTIIFTYKGIYDIDNKIIKHFINGTISRKNRLKIIPFIPNHKIFFIKNNKPILLAKKIKVNFSNNNNFEIEICADLPFISKIIEKLKKKKISFYLGLTIETLKQDIIDEELLCVLGLNKLNII